MRSELRACLSIAAVCIVVGCGLGEEIDSRECPQGGTTLTYESFGEPFLQTYCQGCHGATGASRRGAPGGYSFETLDEARAHADRIYARAAAGNTTMPPGPDDPPADEREKLAEWLACGAP